METLRIETYPDGIAICGRFPDDAVVGAIESELGRRGAVLPLVIADPPYGNIVDKAWDRVGEDDRAFAAWMIDWTKVLERLLAPGGAAYVWGGVGRPREGKKPPFRPFFRYLIEVELRTSFQLSTPITWRKRRAYGIPWGYLFTREECAYLVKGDVRQPRQFTVPLLATKRGYAGYDPAHPAKSEYFRRTNVWDDVTEILRGKVHVNQKPRRLFEIPIEVHTLPGETVLDPFAGSGTTAHAARHLGRRFIVVEQDPIEFEKLAASLRQPLAGFAGSGAALAGGEADGDATGAAGGAGGAGGGDGGEAGSGEG